MPIRRIKLKSGYVLFRLAVASLLFTLLPFSAAQQAPSHKTKKTDAIADARRALFVESDLPAARAHADAELKRTPHNPDALFLGMEASALQADTAPELDFAVRLCELPNDTHVETLASIAAARILDLASNTRQFRAVMPRIQAIVAAGSAQSNSLRAALIAAASDGAPGTPLLTLAHQAGLVTDWRIAGPFGHHGNVDFDRSWPPEGDQLSMPGSAHRLVEEVRFEDGNFNLPDYFARKGVFYAAASVTIPAKSTRVLRVESSGTVEVYVDGASVLRKDDRFRTSPEIAAISLEFSAGKHSLLVKFIPSALPFRVAVLPAPRATTSVAKRSAPLKSPEPQDAASLTEAAYIDAAVKYWSGDFSGAISTLNATPHASAIMQYLLSQSWSRATDDAPEEGESLAAAAQASAGALAAEYQIAVRAHAANRVQDSLRHLQPLLTQRPDYSPAQELAAQIAIDNNLPAEAAKALDAALALHPSCSTLRAAAKFYSSRYEFQRVRDVTQQMGACSPGSLAYAEALSQAGDHDGAAAAAAAAVKKSPYHRGARVLLIRELALAGHKTESHDAAQQLAALAPNSDAFKTMAEAAPDDLTGIGDDTNTHSRELAGLDRFYSHYRRNAFDIAKQVPWRKWANDPAVVLLNDHVAELEPDGTTALYVHRITRVQNRDGIELYGEVSLPSNASILELRTIQPDGTVVEPEFNQHKATISMPALSPKALIDEEYVLRHPDTNGISGHPDDFRFTFGSFRHSIAFARFVVITPAGTQIDSSGDAGAPSPYAFQEDNREVRLWERNDIDQLSEESFMPRMDTLPTVRAVAVSRGGWSEVQDGFRDQLIDLVRIGSRVQQAASLIKGNSEDDKARAIYEYVNEKVRNTGGSLASDDLASAEESLSSGTGSRTVTFLSLARACGLDADLLLTRDLSSNPVRVPSRFAYSRPLVLVRLPNARGEKREVVVDMENEGLEFGALPPTVEVRDALLIPPQTKPGPGLTIVSIAVSPTAEKSVAEGDLTFTRDGDLKAHVSINLGTWRAAQMRSVLSGIDAAGRPRFFEQMAGRIFPGAMEVKGEVHNEDNTDQPLELVFDCTSPHALNLTAGQTDMDQLVPALGLRKMYINSPARRFPLYIDTPLFETTTFHVHLPPGVDAAAGLPDDFNLSTDFGSYTLTFQQPWTGELEIRREFHVPVQVVTPGKYQEFVDFAARIDSAERERISISKITVQAAE